MFFRAAVLSLLGCLLFLHLESEVRHAGVAATSPAVRVVVNGPAAPAPPTPVPPAADPAEAARHTLVAPETRLVDISGRELDRLFTETDPARAARIVPSLTNGRPSGVKIYAIRPASLFDAIGLRNGDTLVTVDDLSVTDAENLTKLADRTTEATWIDLLVMRKGYPVRIVVLVHR